MSQDSAPSQGSSHPSRHSVLQYLAEILGEAPKVVLDDEGSGAGHSPMIDPSSPEKGNVPKRKGGYRFLGEIARGGMGVVLKGHDNDLGRDVAVKVLHKELSSRPEMLHRFVEEAQIGGQLQHPGIVPVYEMGLMDDKRPYFTMKLVKGRTLGAILAERSDARDNRRRLLDIFEAMCQTMAYAHSRKVVHRDLKPANIMVGAFGEVQVVDWGLAKVLNRGGIADERMQQLAQTNISIIETVRSDPGSKGSESMVGSVLGTPAYMSPEQARGDVEKLDARSDVFSLGAILCEILTGQPPYTGKPEEILEKAAGARLDNAMKGLDACDADPELIDLVKASLAPAQTARPHSAQVLAERLHDFQVSTDDRAHKAQIEAAEARVHAVEERKARRLTLALAGTVLLFLVAGGGGWFLWSSQRAQRVQGLRDEIAKAVKEANLLRGQELWAQALAAAERAASLARTGVNPELLAEVEEDLSKISESKNAAERQEYLLTDTAELMTELARVRRPANTPLATGGPATTPPAELAAEIDQQYSQVFSDHGMEVDKDPPEELAKEITSRGVAEEIAGILDEWSLHRQTSGDRQGCQRLNRISDLCDVDESRRQMRPAIFSARLKELGTLARSPETSSWSALSLNLLGAALLGLGDSKTALSILQRAVDKSPADYVMRINLGRASLKATTSGPFALFPTVRHYQAALMLRPDSVEALQELAILLTVSRDYPAATKMLNRAVELSNNSPDAVSLLAVTRLADGDLEGALELARPEKVRQSLLAGWGYVQIIVGIVPPKSGTRFCRELGLPAPPSANTPSGGAGAAPGIVTSASNQFPADGDLVAQSGDLSVTLVADFPVDLNLIVAKRWQVRSEQGDYRNPVMDFLCRDQTSEHKVPIGHLAPNQSYFWRVLYATKNGSVSEYSEETTLRTGDFSYRVTPLNLMPYFTHDVISDPDDRSGDFFDSQGCRLLAAGFQGDTTGLPESQKLGVHVLGDYAEANAIQITKKSPETIRIAVPAVRFSAIHFVTAATNGGGSVPVRLEWVDGTYQLVQLMFPDWFSDPEDQGFPVHCTPLLNDMNRFCLGSVEESADVALFEAHFPIDNSSELVTIDLHAPSGAFGNNAARAYLFAITLVEVTD